MKGTRKLFSILTALALCLSLFPVPALAAGTTLTKPLDFTNVGTDEGQTPAKGPGYELTGDSNSGYTLVLDGLSLNATEYTDTQYWGMRGRTAISLPEDGPVTVELRGTNTISASCQWEDEHAIYVNGSFPLTVQGSGKLVSNVENAPVYVGNTGDMIIKGVTIEGVAHGTGIFSYAGSISIENSNISISVQGTNASAIYAGKNITIKNSNIIASCEESTGICAQEDITITGGTITATSNAGEGTAKILAFGSLSINGGANVTAKGSAPFGIFANGGTMNLSQSEISANGTTLAIYANGGVTLKGMSLIEPLDGTMGQKGVLNASGGWATSAKLGEVTLNAPASTPTCTYGDTDTAKVALTTTPAITSKVEIYGGDAKLGEGNLGEEITINTSGLSAGNATFTAKLPNGLGEKDFIVKINPKPLTVTGATATSRAYDGTKEVVVTAVTLGGVLDADSGKVSVDTTNLKGTIDSAGVGTYTSVTLPELTLTGAAAENYTLTQPSGAVTANVTISKGTYAGTKTAETSGKFGVSKTFDLGSLLPDGTTAGAASVTSGSDIFTQTPSVSGGVLSYTLVNDEQKVGETAKIKVTVSSPNYADFDFTITVTVADKYVPTLTVSPITVTYTGEAVPDSAIQGTAKVGDTTISGTWSFTAGQALTAVADSGEKTIKFTPDEAHAAEYAEAEGTVMVTIAKATPTGTPTYTAISAGGKTLADAGLTAPAGWPAGTLSWSDVDTTEVTANAQYQWTFTPADTDNYNTLTGEITLWTQSSGGSTGGGGSSRPSLPVTTDKSTENGTTTTDTTAKPSATVKGDTASATVSGALGSEIVKQAEQNKSDNVVIAPEIKGDVAKTEVSIPASTVGEIGSRTQASLTISTPVADVTIPNGGLASLASEGGTISVTAEVKGDTVELTVTADGETVQSVPGGMTVTVPAKGTKPGTVAMLVHEDGTQEVIRKSVAGEASVTIPLDGSAKLEIVDNSKTFADVPDSHWASDAVAFASARELFRGTAPDTFSPSLPMSRGMLAVVLHNLENNPAQTLTGAFADVDDGHWYAEGVAWATSQGIVSGYGNGMFGPDDNITREQLAVILWRYAGSPAATEKELHFTDADKASGYALEALRWAVENGVMGGYGNGQLAPQGLATRAQVAQMLMNFLKNK